MIILSSNFIFFIIPFIMIICGFLMYMFPPKNRFGFNGYRTKRSRKSDESFLFAQKYCGKLWLICGILLFLIIFLLIKFNICKSIILLPIEILILILTIIPVELSLKKKFGD